MFFKISNQKLHKIKGNELSAIFEKRHSYKRISSCGSVDKLWMLFIHYYVVQFFFIMAKMYFLLYLVESKCSKIQYRKIPSLVLNVLEVFCSLYSQFFSDLYKKLQEAFVYITNVEYQIWCSCCNLFLSYVDKRHTDTQIKC